MKKVYLLALAVIGFSANSFAQTANATAVTNATIVTPIAITKLTNMNFGTIASNSIEGTVVLGTDNSRLATDVRFPTGGSGSAAVFTITGEGNSTFAISLPGTITLTSPSSATMTVSNFVSSLGASSTLASGTKTLNVGATLTVPASAVAGLYTNAAGLSVTVNYN